MINYPLKNLKNIDPKNYVRLFEFRNYPFFYESLWLQFYQDYKAICINVDNLRTAYIPKSQYHQLKANGYQLYSDPGKISNFRNEFDIIEREILEYTNELRTRDKALFKLPQLFRDWFKYYSLTDFPCTEASKEVIEEYFPDFGIYKEKKRNTINLIAVGEDCNLLTFLRRYSKDHSVDNDLIQLYTVEELLNGDDFIDSLRKNSVMTLIDNKYFILVGTEAREVANKMRSKQLGRGTVAKKGIIKGVAYVFHNDMSTTSEILPLAEKMPFGSILICETTSPELAPLYTQSAGLITAQGGIMSHAAIIAREMGLPCIVGMENATRYFKTGDLIELNAEKGFVKIIERS